MKTMKPTKRKSPAAIKTKLLLSGIAIMQLALVSTAGAQVIYSDDFNRADSTGSWGTADTGGNWTVVNDGTARQWNISSNTGVLDVSGSGADNNLRQASLSPTAFSFDDSNSIYEFGANIRVTENSGQEWNELVNGGNKAVAWSLGGTDSDLLSGNGYAVALYGDNTSTGQVLQFGTYTGGLTSDTFSSLISTSVAGTDALDFFNIRVTLNTNSNQWELFMTQSATAFSDPLSVTTSIGTAVDSTYTSSSLTGAGFVTSNRNASGNDATFDNLSAGVSVIPEPSAVALLLAACGVGLLLAGRRRRSNP